MKLCILGTIDNPHTRRWVEYFVGQGNQVYVLCDPPAEYQAKAAKISHPQMNFFIKVLAFKLCPCRYSNNFFKVLSYRREVRKIKPDIVHGFECLGYGFALAHCGPFPKVLTPWGNDIFDYPKQSRLARVLVGHALKKANIITTNMPNLADVLTQEFNVKHAKIRPFSWGIDLTIFRRDYDQEVGELKKQLNIPAEAKVIISNRQMNPYWGIDHIVKAIPEVVNFSKDVYFIFLRGAGSEHYEKEIRQLAQRLKVEAHTRFIPKFLSAHQMAIYLNLADIFVSVPYTDLLSISVLEALACGSIPILSDCLAYRTRVKEGENGFYVPAGNSQAMAEKIIYCLQHPELKEAFYRHTRPIMEREDDWKKNAGKMTEIYRGLIESQRKISLHSKRFRPTAF